MTFVSDDRPSIGERYQIASDGTYTQDPDMLIAAGWCPEKLGVMLLRLRGEFDSIKADIKANSSETNFLLILTQLKTLRATKEAIADLAMKRASVQNFAPLPKMPTAIKEMKAWRAQVDKRTRIIQSIAGKALQVFLDPNCQPCNGVGAIGGYGAPLIVCRACGGSSKAKTRIGQNEEQRQFAAHLISILERATSQAERGIKGNLRNAKEVRKLVGDAR